MQSFTVFQETTRSLDARNKRLTEGRRTSPLGDLLKEGAVGSAVGFDDVMVADFLLYFLSRSAVSNGWGYWWPAALVYMDRHGRGLEVFVRCRSTAYFNRVKGMLGVADTDALTATIAAIEANKQMLPSWSMSRVYPGVVMNVDAIGTLP